jgi:hypothetical protein
MFPPLHGSKVWLASASCCVSSSEVVFLLVVCITQVEIKALPILSREGLLFCLVMGLIIGLIKSFIVSIFAYSAKPFLRWDIILGSTFALTVFEGFLYYKLLTLPSPNFG